MVKQKLLIKILGAFYQKPKIDIKRIGMRNYPMHYGHIRQVLEQPLGQHHFYWCMEMRL